LLGLILQARGDLAGAQRQTERAPQIFLKIYGPDDSRTIAQQKMFNLLKNDH
jgi:hypothetical protein